ncbi:hypothetical protein [Usitatibacter palustris]|uniref:Uncharacterized protein n=1 Tax=Usitatibacter palustris TaxID=2732487 RepID=A0A6M4H9B2_9PROT|nr:hypothetical protein [Usitatibacter palustris]QJR15785.1 hypothetical protein DSM104440_02611 [Usitatibacter palustris]
MPRTRTPENTPRTLGLALSLWGLGIAAAGLSGAFSRFSPEELGGIALFAFVFATATAWLDRGVRAWLEAVSPRALFSFVIEADVLIALSAMLSAGLVEGSFLPALARFPLVLVGLFVVPVAATAHLVALARLLRVRKVPVQLTGRETTPFAAGRAQSAR